MNRLGPRSTPISGIFAESCNQHRQMSANRVRYDHPVTAQCLAFGSRQRLCSATPYQEHSPKKRKGKSS